MIKGPQQLKLEELCSQIFDDMGLPDEERIRELEIFLNNIQLKELKFKVKVKSTILDEPTILRVIEALTMHEFNAPQAILKRKRPDLFNRDAKLMVKKEQLIHEFSTFTAQTAVLGLLSALFYPKAAKPLCQLAQLCSKAVNATKKEDMTMLLEIESELKGKKAKV